MQQLARQKTVDEFLLGVTKNSRNNQQRRNTSEQNVIFAEVQSFADGDCRCVKIWLHRFDITQSPESKSMKSVIEDCFSRIRQVSGTFRNSAPLYRSRLFPDFCARQHICYCAHTLSQFRLSVCPSVRPSHGWFMQKRLKLGSCSFHSTVAPSL